MGAVVVVSIQVTAHQHNNFEIFRTAWANLSAGRDLYGANPQHRDFFLYSPTFALLFAPFAVLPTWLGVLLWNAANAAALYWGLGRVLGPEDALAARLIVFLDAVGSMQQAQSNALVAGLMILAFAAFERRREGGAAALITLGTAVKIFPIVAAAGAIFRPYRVPRFALWSMIAAVVAVAAPLLVVSPATLVAMYRAWLAAPSPVGVGFSIMEHLRLWTGTSLPNWPVQAAGMLVLLSPLVQVPHWGQRRFRLLFLASLLMFCVLFNHAAESPSFVIAVAGVALWFVLVPRTRATWIVLGVVVVGTVLSSSDAMPEAVQRSFFEPYRVKTLPVLLVWVLTQVELWRRNVSAPFPDSAAARQALAA